MPPTPGELAELVDVNFLSRKLHVSRQRDSRSNLLVPTKTKSSVRSVPLGQVVVHTLAAHLAKYPAADDDSIFTDDHGRPLTYELWRSVWKATGATFKTHDLRHYAASALIAGGSVGEAGPVDPRPRLASGNAGRLLALMAGRRRPRQVDPGRGSCGLCADSGGGRMISAGQRLTVPRTRCSC